MSNKAYARHRQKYGLPGATHQAVRKALDSGRIHKNEFGLIDPETADRDWLENTSPSMQRMLGSDRKLT